MAGGRTCLAQMMACYVKTLMKTYRRDGTLSVDLPLIKEALYGKVDASEETEEDDAVHPLSKQAETYVLYDRLHETNATQEREKLLRSVRFVPQLRGNIW